MARATWVMAQSRLIVPHVIYGRASCQSCDLNPKLAVLVHIQEEEKYVAFVGGVDN